MYMLGIEYAAWCVAVASYICYGAVVAAMFSGPLQLQTGIYMRLMIQRQGTVVPFQFEWFEDPFGKLTAQSTSSTKVP